MKKCYLLSTTEGCATNLLENAGHRSHYEALGYGIATSPEDADVIVINTCAYNQLMEDRATSIITHYQDRYLGKEIVVSGCLPKINPGKTKELVRGTILQSNPRSDVFANHHQFHKEDFERLSFKHRLVLRLRPYYFELEKFAHREFKPLHNIFKTVVVNEDFFLLTVSTGCIGKCTFCAIKRAKGSLKSRPLPVLLSEFEKGIEAGHKSFWLLGDDIGCWGQDIGSSIVDLLAGILKRKESFSLVLNYLDPHYLQKYPEQLSELLSDPRVCGINIPIQSGSPSILQAMERHYDPALIYSLLQRIKKKNRGVAIKTNIMIGFPGETWRDFLRSARAVAEFDAVLAMKYSPRPHTPAAKLTNQVTDQVKALRLAMLNSMILARHAFVAIRSFF